jgi:nitrite reductase (NADH) large subunit
MRLRLRGIEPPVLHLRGTKSTSEVAAVPPIRGDGSSRDSSFVPPKSTTGGFHLRSEPQQSKETRAFKEVRVRQKLVVIGNGMVGFKLLEKLTNMQHDFDITVLCEEVRPAYDRVHLSSYFTNKNADSLSLAPLPWYSERNIDLRLGEGAKSIDRNSKKITISSGEILAYDKLVLATGSAPFVPNVPGIQKKGVFVYRTIEDLDSMIYHAKACKKAAVIGGGLLGLEAAKALLDLGLEAHVIEFAPRLMPRQLDAQGSSVLQKKIEALGVSVHLNKNSKEVLGEESVTGLQFTDDTVLELDMIVVSAGIRPRDELAKQAGLTLGERGGILVNDHLQTSDPDIYAIGECALHGTMVYGLVAPGYRQAETAAKHLLGEDAHFKGADLSTKLKLLGVDVASIGNATLETAHTTVTLNSRLGVYKKLIYSDEQKLLGAILVGDASDYGTLLNYYQQKTTLPDVPESLLVAVSEKSAGAGVAAFSDESTICSCENVNKGSITQQIQAGCHDVVSLKKSCKAGTGCGSCVPLLNDLITLELEKAGVAVDKSLCEHFPYTRQELLEVVKLSQIKTYDELLGRHGRGRGCEICKPAVASMLASTWNEHVMEHQTIQDTNDTFMANIQRNGTYSVVPRVPGGELTPDQLIAIGAVAKDFNLYTKITGGQRIDLFGARLEDLPIIWAQLGEAGLESGHAYAKALRTVKSCVGSTWCRYGVQDSTTLAIDIENRYKGLRAPHKIKMAVSGCARECAEAQGKDVGVIATEKGWNLYVCGNGGMKPQHAVLLANDIDTQTLIQYIDRFLMYYVRTAERLTRTATWLNKLEGGIEHVKDVVIHDKLGLAETLEQEMQHIVDTYQCEWKTTVNNPEQLERFKPFVNVNERDSSIQFTEVRGQPLPVVMLPILTEPVGVNAVAGDD